MTSINLDEIADILSECAKSYILPRYKALEDHEISSKTGPNDLVTQADIDVEAHLERVLPALLPGSIVVGEEAVSRGSASLDVLADETQMVWVVDPVDGTHNFVHHKREFGIMLACVIGGEVRYGWIYDVLGEACAVMERGAGAYFEGQRLQVSQESQINALSGHLNPRYFPKEYRPHIKEAGTKFKSCQSLHCAAHEYLRIAKGEAHFALYSRMKAWDHLPGALMVEEAGGYVAKWDRTPYRPQDHHVGLLAAASQENWEQVYEIFLKEYL